MQQNKSFIVLKTWRWTRVCFTLLYLTHILRYLFTMQHTSIYSTTYNISVVSLWVSNIFFLFLLFPFFFFLVIPNWVNHIPDVVNEDGVISMLLWTLASCRGLSCVSKARTFVLIVISESCFCERNCEGRLETAVVR